jgi:spermidine synthase
MTAAVLTCFFLSGASSLALELVWTRELTLVFGSTALAMSTVLSVFMGGLGLGSLLAGRIADRISDRPRAYALCEGGIGLYAIMVPFFLRGYPGLNQALYQTLGDHPVGLSLGRFIAAALLLIVPTTMMGATLPVLARHFAGDGEAAGTRRRIGATVGGLYALNTFGEVTGTFFGGFVLLPAIGVTATNYAAAGINLALAVLVLVTRNRRPERDPEPAAAAEPDDFIATPRDRRLALVAFGLSGAAAMVCQVLWTRALAIVIGSSVYSFTLILLAFLIGLGCGAALCARLLHRSRRPTAWLGLVHFAVAATIALSVRLMDRLPGAFLALLRGGSFSVDGIIFCQFVLAALAVLPATLCMGAVLPLTVRIYAARRERVGRDVGIAYSVNTLGAIVGSFAAGFLVLPLLGLERGLKLGAFISLALAAAFLLVGASRRVVAAMALCLVGLGIARLPRWSLEHFSAGLFRVSIAREIIEADKWSLPRLEYYHDGIATTVSVEKWGKTLALKNNGKVDASNGDDMATQIMVGLMPLIFHPTALERPPKVAVIGFGSGVTIGAVSQFPIGHADVVELEPAVVEAGVRYFGPYNHHPESNPKIRVLIGDGRNFLNQAPALGPAADRYDVIISEPSNPWITGVSNLFTTDYWTLARGRLAEDGVFCQWAQLYEMSPRNIKTILRSFASVFPYTYVFAAEDLSSDVILVAANHPLPLDVKSLERNFAHPTLGPELRRGGVGSAEDVISYLLLTPDEIPAFTAGSPVNTDDNALIEFNAPRDLYGYMRYDPYLARVYGTDWPYGRFEQYLTGLGEGPERAATEQRLARALLQHGKRAQAIRFADRAHAHGAAPGRVDQLIALLSERPVSDDEVPLARVSEPDTPGTPGTIDPLGLDALDPPRVPPGTSPSEAARIAHDYLEVERSARAKAWAHALYAIRAWPEKYVDEGGLDLELLVGFLLYKADLNEDAIDRLKPLVDDAAFCARRPAALYYLARAEYGDAMYEPAVRNMERYLERAASAPRP